MPGAAAAAVNVLGNAFLTVFGAYSVGATAMAARTAEIPMKADPVRRPDNEQILADVRGGNQTRAFEGFDASRRLIGPIVTVWTCLEAAGLAPGDLAFFDPALAPRGDDIVLVWVRGELTVKILEHVAGDWWLRTSDGDPPGWVAPMGVHIIGRHVATISLPPTCATVRWALAETERVTASIPVGWQAEQRAFAAQAIKELAERDHVDRRAWAGWQPPDDHFWSVVSRRGLPVSTVAARAVRGEAD